MVAVIFIVTTASLLILSVLNVVDNQELKNNIITTAKISAIFGLTAFVLSLIGQKNS